MCVSECVSETKLNENYLKIFSFFSKFRWGIRLFFRFWVSEFRPFFWEGCGGGGGVFHWLVSQAS